MRSKAKLMAPAAAVMVVLWLIGVGLSASDQASRQFNPAMGHNLPAGVSGRVTSIVMRGTHALQTAQATSQKQPIMVEDVFTNVQALKNVTVDEFMGTMGLMSAALGFCCSDCHTGAGTDKVKWEDDNPTKRTARRMVFMVQALNKENFNGRQVVTCWTCHRGRDTPVMTPLLDQVYSEPTVFLDDVLTTATGTEAPEVLINKFIEAIGGAQKVAAVTSVVAEGKSTGFGGFGGGGQVELFAQMPDKRSVFIHFPDDPDRGDSTRTFDGKTGWIATPLAVVRKYPLTGGELDGARLDAQLTFPSQITKVLTNLRTGPPTEVMGKTVNVVQGRGARNSLANLYFDRDTRLLVRIVRLTPSAIGKVPTQVDYSDYKDVNGVKFPMRWTFTWLDGRDNIEWTNVKFNQPIDASKFSEPNPLNAQR